MFTRLRNYIQERPKLKQWLWFIGLWFAGLATITLVGKIIKWMMGI